ncbi:Uncharacterized protein containing a Zn-ribbon (DUF2116) [Thermoplasmatales archaeon BRNA1]|nr:Uncharacterized protein containing a Zn-ribbon (DUF2116) [Thermoplasmatales archaeon BRNA1]
MTDERPVKIPQHRHCLHCGKAFTGAGFNERFCSQECLDAEGSEAKRKLKKYAVFMVALWAIVAVAVLVVGF